MRKITIVSLLFVALALIISGCCDKGGAVASKPKGGKTLASIGSETITVEEFQARINKQNPYLRARFADPARRKEFLDTMIKGEVLFQKAQSLGYDKEPDVLDRMKNDTIQKMINKEFDEKMKDSLVSADDVKKFYTEHNADYNKPEAVWVKAIQIKEKAKADAALKEARAKPEDQALFVELVKKYSQDEKTNKVGGDITYRTREEITADYGKELADAAFAMDKVGEVSPKVVSAKGVFYVVRLQGKRPAQSRTLDQVESQIKNRLYYEKRTQAFEKWLGDMVAASKVTRNDTLLADIKIEGGATPPPGMPMPGAPGGQGPTPMSPMMKMPVPPVQPPQGK
ncbi:MAG: peptidyl-prolyl cis-trans isomerase [Myxococcota bacterium]|jgi:peptidyl-prolyl cis-trans isomerase C